MGERRQNTTAILNFMSESYRNEERFQVAPTKETKEALKDLNSIRNWNQLRHICEEQERQRKKGPFW